MIFKCFLLHFSTSFKKHNTAFSSLHWGGNSDHQSLALARGSCGCCFILLHPNFRPWHLAPINEYSSSQLPVQGLDTVFCRLLCICNIPLLCTSLLKRSCISWHFGCCPAQSIPSSGCDRRQCLVIGISLNFLFCQRISMPIDAKCHRHL